MKFGESQFKHQEGIPSGEVDMDYDEFYQEFLEEQERASQINRELTKEELEQEATTLLEKAFKKYDPKGGDAEIPFYAAAYELNGLYFPYAPPENTGSLEPGITKRIVGILHVLATKYPQAVQSFAKTFDIQLNEALLDGGNIIEKEKRKEVSIATADDAVAFLDKVHRGEIAIESITYNEAMSILDLYASDSTDIIDLDAIEEMFEGKDTMFINGTSAESLSALTISNLRSDFANKDLANIWDRVMQGGELTMYNCADVRRAVDHVVRVASDPTISRENIRQEMFSIAGDIFEKPADFEEFSQEILSRLDLDDKSHFAENAALLDAIRYIEQQNRDYIERSREEFTQWDSRTDNKIILNHNALKEQLTQLRAQNKGSYLLNAKIDHILKEDVRYDKYDTVSTDNMFPFQITPDRFAFYSSEERSLLIIGPQDFEKARELLAVVDAYKALRFAHVKFLEESIGAFAQFVSEDDMPTLSYSVNPHPHSLFGENTDVDAVDYEESLDEKLMELAMRYPDIHEKTKDTIRSSGLAALAAKEKFEKLMDQSGESSHNILETKLLFTFLRGQKLSTDMIFVSGATDEEAASALMDYQYLVSEFMRNHIQEHFGVTLADLSFAEQNHFLQFIKDRTVENVLELQVFSKKFGIQGARTFLSLEHGGQEMGEKIVTIGERLPQEIATKVFSKYGELVDVSQEISDIFSEEDISEEQLSHMQGHLLLRGKKVLEVAAQYLENDSFEVKDIAEKTIAMLAKVQADVEATKALITSAKMEGKTFEDLKAVRIEKIGRERSGEVRDHYQQMIKNESVEMQEALMQKFDQSITAGAVIEGVMDRDKIVASLLTTTENDGKDMRISALIGDSLYGELSLGNHLLHTVIDKNKEQYKHIYGDASLMRMRAYIGRYDAVGTDVLHYGGEPSLQVDFGTRHAYDSASLSKKEALALLEKEDHEGRVKTVFYDAETLPEKEMQDGYVVTHIYPDKPHDRNVFVLEKVVEERF